MAELAEETIEEVPCPEPPYRKAKGTTRAINAKALGHKSIGPQSTQSIGPGGGLVLACFIGHILIGVVS